MKVNITLEIDDVIKKPIDEWEDDDMEKLDEAKKKPQGNIIKLDKNEMMNDMGESAEPLEYTVKEGDTLKSISEKFDITYGELITHLQNTEGNTSIPVGKEIKIPRYYKDLSKAS